MGWCGAKVLALYALAIYQRGRLTEVGCAIIKYAGLVGTVLECHVEKEAFAACHIFLIHFIYELCFVFGVRARGRALPNRANRRSDK